MAYHLNQADAANFHRDFDVPRRSFFQRKKSINYIQ